MESRLANSSESSFNFSSEAAGAAGVAGTRTIAVAWLLSEAAAEPASVATSLSAVIAHGTMTCVLFSSRAKSASDGTRLMAVVVQVQVLHHSNQCMAVQQGKAKFGHQFKR